MATQGVLSVVVDGKVKVKVTIGHDGHELDKLVPWLKYHITKDKSPNIGLIIFTANQVLDGNTDWMVVSDDEKDVCVYPDGQDELPLHPRYRSTFNKPDFNPQWEQGTADYVKVIEINMKGI